ncbi:pyrroline-5-carboxylate reductase, partial [candidate division FCPU426 bacterium]|nr:pyrroline-5-carboxylate reductase [candidate division FCPU426 bacterium]
AVKPQQVREVLADIRPALQADRHVLLSIAAGIPTAYIEKHAGCALRVARIMPNTPARQLSGATAFCLGRHAGEDEAALTRRLFSAVGTVLQVEEHLLDAITALSGSGPAYVFKLCEMMAAAGVSMGVPATAAEALAVQTIWGAASMLKAGGQSAAELRMAVTSAGGTTQAALAHLAASDFEAVFKAALHAAKKRSVELSAVLEAED